MSLPTPTSQNSPGIEPQEAQVQKTSAQRRTVLSHPKLAMKKLSLVALTLFAFLILGSVTGVSAAAEKMAGKFADRFVFLVHVAQLYTKDADKKLAMPVQDVSTKQVANTWHAPRDGGRLHEGQDIFAARGTPILSATEGYVENIGEEFARGSDGFSDRRRWQGLLLRTSRSLRAAPGGRRLCNDANTTRLRRHHRQCRRHATASSFRSLRIDAWRHESFAAAQRSTSRKEALLTEPEAAVAAIARFTGSELMHVCTWGFAALHPRLYAPTRSAG